MTGVGEDGYRKNRQNRTRLLRAQTNDKSGSNHGGSVIKGCLFLEKGKFSRLLADSLF